MFEVRDHILHQNGRPVLQRPSPNRGGVMKTIDYLVVHYTGGVSADGAVNTLTNPKLKVSAHLVIAPDGSVTQLVPFNVVAWHAGISMWKKRAGCNNFTIGIEHVNPGLLARTGAGGFATRLEGRAVAAKDVILAEHKNGRGGVLPWAKYPAAQIEASIAIAQALNVAYKFKDILGHEDIAPIRKTDPGPAWPMDSYVARVLGRDGKAG